MPRSVLNPLRVMKSDLLTLYALALISCPGLAAHETYRQLKSTLQGRLFAWCPKKKFPGIFYHSASRGGLVSEA